MHSSSQYKIFWGVTTYPRPFYESEDFLPNIHLQRREEKKRGGELTGREQGGSHLYTHLNLHESRVPDLQKPIPWGLLLGQLRQRLVLWPQQTPNNCWTMSTTLSWCSVNDCQCCSVPCKRCGPTTLIPFLLCSGWLEMLKLNNALWTLGESWWQIPSIRFLKAMVWAQCHSDSKSTLPVQSTQGSLRHWHLCAPLRISHERSIHFSPDVMISLTYWYPHLKTQRPSLTFSTWLGGQKFLSPWCKIPKGRSLLGKKGTTQNDCQHHLMPHLSVCRKDEYAGLRFCRMRHTEERWKV